MKEIYGKKIYDTLGEIVNPRHTALLVIDVQNDFCSPEGQFGRGGLETSALQKLVPKVIQFIDEARKTGIFVAFIQNTTLRNGLSDSPAWLHFKSKASGVAPEYTIEGTWGHRFCDGLEPREDEPVIQKYRSSAFINTHLDLVLRSNGIESIIITGCVTHGCVLATARHGAFLDYYVVVAKDCVESNNAGLHEAALRIMESRLDVVSSEEILNEWFKLNKQGQRNLP
jgi:nicotinamidase-related amidase